MRINEVIYVKVFCKVLCKNGNGRFKVISTQQNENLQLTIDSGWKSFYQKTEANFMLTKEISSY